MATIEATVNDIPQLASHHRKMFEEMWKSKGQVLETTTADEIERNYASKLHREIPTGDCKVWVVKINNRLIASGAITINKFVPVPTDTNSNIAYMHSVYTEKDYRGQKYAQLIIEEIIKYCKNLGIKRVTLNASEAGRPLYEKFGFCHTPEAMRLLI